MMVPTAILTAMAFLGLTTPASLLLLTFLLGLGAALSMPASQAIVQEMVPRDELTGAVTLNSVAVNVARALGPALGGLLLAFSGTGWVFLLNTLSFVGVIVVLARWQRPPKTAALPPEHFWAAIAAGMRYTRYAPSMQAILVRTGLFCACSSALFALLPLLAGRDLSLPSYGYGLLLGCLGLGGVTGAAILPVLRRQMGMDALVLAATLVLALTMGCLALSRNTVMVGAAMVIGGIAYVAILSSLNVAVQTATAVWVRARALSLYQLIFQGATGVGSFAWGLLAAHGGNRTAILWAAGGMAAQAILVRCRLGVADAAGLAPCIRSEPGVVVEPRLDTGLVLVTTEYRIDPARTPEFVQAMDAMKRMRRRNGVLRWDLFTVPDAPERYIEALLSESWLEHLRQGEQRVTVADAAVKKAAHAFHVGPEPPAVTHLIAVDSRKTPRA